MLSFLALSTKAMYQNMSSHLYGWKEAVVLMITCSTESGSSLFQRVLMFEDTLKCNWDGQTQCH